MSTPFMNHSNDQIIMPSLQDELIVFPSYEHMFHNVLQPKDSNPARIVECLLVNDVRIVLKNNQICNIVNYSCKEKK